MPAADREEGHLHADARMVWLRLREAMSALGHPIALVEGLRSAKRQDALYAQGRTVAGSIVTNARAGQSWHQTGRAFDVCFATPPHWSDEHPWELLGQAGELLGAEWGGRWKRPDRPHFQVTGGLTLVQALEKRAGGTT